MPTWTPQQLQCLEALKIPVMAFVAPSGSASLGSPKVKTQRAAKVVSSDEALTKASDTPFFYRLGPWFFKSSTHLPVTGIPWMNDLAAYADTRLSQTSNVGDALNIDAYIQGPLSAEQKRELWNLLKARLKKQPSV